MLNYRVILTKHNGVEPSDFKMSRPSGTTDYLFLHFQSPIFFTLQDEQMRLSAGSCIILTPSTPHAFHSAEGDLIHDWMHFMPSDQAAFARLGLPLNTVFTPGDTSFITSLIRRCELECIDRRDHYEDMLSALTSELMIRLLRHRQTPLHAPHAEAIRHLRRDVYRDPKRFTTTEDMAREVGLSRSRFAVVYRELIGTPPKNDLILARVAKASYLLSFSTRSLADISEICGYQSVYHFIRQFREVTGVTPGKYRKNS